MGAHERAKGPGIEELVQQYHNSAPGDQESILEKVLKDNEHLVKHLMYKHYPSYVKSHGEDMLQEANIAIIRHFSSFDPEKGRFSTYMGVYIMEAFKWYVCGLHNITSHYFTQYKKYKNARENLIRRGVTKITADVLAEEMGCGIDAVFTAVNIANYMNSDSIEGDEREKSLSCYGQDVDPVSACEDNERKEALLAALGRLSKFEQEVVSLTYLNDEKELSLKEVSTRLGTDVAAVRRARNKALRQLSADPELIDVLGGERDQELRHAADEIVIEFSVSKESIDGNLAIALDIDLEL